MVKKVKKDNCDDGMGVGGPCLKIRYLCKNECQNVEKLKDKDLYGDGFDRGRGYKITCTDDDGIPTLMGSKFSITRCFCAGEYDLLKIKDNYIFLEAKQLCNAYHHSAAEGSTKMSFEWLN